MQHMGVHTKVNEVQHNRTREVVCDYEFGTSFSAVVAVLPSTILFTICGMIDGVTCIDIDHSVSKRKVYFFLRGLIRLS